MAKLNIKSEKTRRLFLWFMIGSSFKCCFEEIICKVFYLRPQADEGLLAFLFGKISSKKFNISIS